MNLCDVLYILQVHGASGLDHFVHRFTHRVVRGLLIAVGRPDGRLCCLAKSEAAVLLSAKQAAFIRNPDYHGESAGPEIVTLGHNPFEPNVGLGHHVVLTNDNQTYGPKSRRKFMDEYIYERLFLASKPFTAAILRALALSRKERDQVEVRNEFTILNNLLPPPTSASASASVSVPISSIISRDKNGVENTTESMSLLKGSNKMHTSSRAAVKTFSSTGDVDEEKEKEYDYYCHCYIYYHD